MDTVAVGLPDFDELKSMLVQDDTGDSLTVSYADIEAAVLPAEDGFVTMVLSLDDDFDPSGPRGHLYRAAAENVANTLLDGWPRELSKAALLPRKMVGRLQPIHALRQQWVGVVGESSP